MRESSSSLAAAASQEKSPAHSMATPLVTAPLVLNSLLGSSLIATASAAMWNTISIPKSTSASSRKNAAPKRQRSWSRFQHRLLRSFHWLDAHSLHLQIFHRRQRQLGRVGLYHITFHIIEL